MQSVPESRTQTFEEIYGPPENFLEIEVSRSQFRHILCPPRPHFWNGLVPTCPTSTSPNSHPLLPITLRQRSNSILITVLTRVLVWKSGPQSSNTWHITEYVHLL